jgi:hypothetical protein
LLSFIDNADDKNLNDRWQSDILAWLKSILKQATELIDEMGIIQNIDDFVFENSLMGDEELNYCKKHAEGIKKIADVIILKYCNKEE